MFQDLSIVPAETGHIYQIISKLRTKDKEFMWTFSGCRPYEFLTKSFSMSPISFTCLRRRVPICIFGVASAQIMSRTGSLWLAACDDASSVRTGAVILGGRKYFQIFRKHFDIIEYFVETTNHDGFRKLSKIGFKKSGEIFPGKHGKAFHRVFLAGHDAQEFLFSRKISNTSNAHS